MNLWNTFSNLAQANVNHYDNHQISHLAATAAYGVLAVIGIGAAARRMAEKDLKNKINHPLP